MATSKEYAYYVKGNRIAVVQKDWTFSGGQTLSQPGLNDLGTMGALLWKSPVEDVTKGIELQYVYSPTYNLQSTGTEGTDFHRFIGWGSDGTNLLLFTFSGASSVVDLSSLFAADDWILISGSGRWSGLHQVKSTGAATGVLTLKTKCNLKPSKITVTGTFEADDETFIGDDTGNIVDIETFKDVINSTRANPHIFITDAAHGNNSGLFSLTSNDTSGKITLNQKISIDTDGDYTETSATATDGGSDEVTIYNAFHEQLSVYENIEVMQDESFEVDVTRYQGNALVYYLKARYAEDAGNIEGKEYFMREFRRMVEKHESNKVIGPRRMQGFSHFSNN